jgi:hypothetical protein
MTSRVVARLRNTNILNYVFFLVRTSQKTLYFPCKARTVKKSNTFMRDFKLPLRCKLGTLVLHYRRFGNLSVPTSSVSPHSFLYNGARKCYGHFACTALPLKKGRMVCSETSVTNYKSTQHNVSEERRSQIAWCFENRR